MRKLLLIITAAAFAISCNRLAENQYEITGTVDPSFNGKNVILETQGGFMGVMPVDTVKVENGKFKFEGETEFPSFHFVQVEGMQGKVDFILEGGEIEITVDKDTVPNSTRKGTYNNDMLTEYYGSMKTLNKKANDFRAKNQAAMMQAMQTQDTITMNKLKKDFEQISKQMEDVSAKFMDKNPKAYITALLLKQMAGSGKMEITEIKSRFEKLDEKVKKSKDGKELSDMIKQSEEQEVAKAKVETGNTAPDFSAATPDGKTMSLKDAMGKVTVIDFWASWCKPCRMENPNVVALYNEYHSQGLNIIGVSLDKDGDKWKEAIAADKLAWNHVSNLKHWDEPIAKQYGVQSIPATFILDANGKIVAKDLRGDALKAKVKELLAAK